MFKQTALLASLAGLAFAGSADADLVTVVEEDTHVWNYFHPLDATDPAVADTDYNTTWYTQNDAGNSYDGPAFSASGSGLFGYGGIAYGSLDVHIGDPGSGSRYTAYFASTFDLSALDASTVTDLTANILSDDGAFIYINGQLAGNQNVDTISADTYFAGTNPGGNFEGSLTAVTLDESLLINGINSIAVSVHNKGPTSSDLGFAMNLAATGDSIPEPSSLALLGLGGLLIARRRRRD